ncbi:MAG TPA: hypothetical protein VFZ00_04250 [Solirubrobacter sp.]|nr:hypothetical protein [Solirubrobacter sp.]
MATTKTPPLDEMRDALKGMGKTLRAGGDALLGDFKTLVRSARKDITKTGKAFYADGQKLARAVRRLEAQTPPRHVPPAAHRHAAPRAKKAAPPAKKVPA